MEDVGRYKEDLPGGKDLSDSSVANPCGLIARSMFNDTYSL